MHIGNRIQEVMLSKEKSARWLAEQIPCERTNIYKIFRRGSIDTKLLKRISVILEHDFFKELSAEIFSENGMIIESANTEIEDTELEQ
ncbi:MAG: XRE family transcriptional regulator [Prevotella sp.]|nr:XRE family transcriptional regulator [Prevotella sp.]